MAGEGEIQFAEPIIHRLQSFLTGKEAARTAIMSKSWHSAWLTRPNLDFDDTHFKVGHRRNDHSRIDKFEKYEKKTIKRYKESNLKIESFKLCMFINQYGCADLAKKLTVNALRIGATRLCLRLKRGDLFVLPNEVFGADNLVELSVSGCTIDLDDGVVIKCRRLESLSLDDNVGIAIDTVSNIVSSCPSIENLSFLPNIYPHHNAFKKVVNNTSIGIAGLVDNLIPRLIRCLVLGYVSFNTLCLDDLLSRFPFLKDFTLYLNRGGNNVDTSFEERIQISNCSLERIKLVLQGFQSYDEGRKPRVKFNVPSVRKFTYEELGQSKTHLSLHIERNAATFDYEVSDSIIQGLHKHELENLTIDMKDLPPLSCYSFFDGLFRVCCPKLITQYHEEDPDKRRYNGRTNIDFLCHTLKQGINIKVSRPTQFLYGLNDLEEVNAQAFDMDDVPAEWRPIPFDAHVQAHQRVRLLLKWKPS
ncbi:hypothetical protein CASFOL_010182 [Castilleja foliolosa]|uniref:Uncharacterized protein n=1 Tax=Castilleja foliolosa TaxID=1961234 RepID=A0ABD3DU38_9LAMI